MPWNKILVGDSLPNMGDPVGNKNGKARDSRFQRLDAHVRKPSTGLQNAKRPLRHMPTQMFDLCVSVSLPRHPKEVKKMSQSKVARLYARPGVFLPVCVLCGMRGDL